MQRESLLMKSSFSLMLSLASAGLLSCPAFARPLPAELAGRERATILSPIGGWTLEAGDDRCRLRRSFTSDEGPGIVLLEQIAPGQRFDLIVAGPDFARARRGSWFYGGMRSDEETETIDPLEFDIPGFDNAIALGGVAIDDYVYAPGPNSKHVAAAIDPAAGAKVERIVLQRSSTIVSFELGNMREPVEALNACTAEFLPKWGLNPKEHAAHEPPQMPQESTFYSRLNHELARKPSNAGHKSLLRVRAMIDEKGSVTSCHHEYAVTSGGEAPDVCEDIAGMTFVPALNAAGEPVASVYSRSVILSEFDPWTADSGGSGRWGS